MNKKIIFIVAILVFSVLFTSCSNVNSDRNSDKNSEAKVSEEEGISPDKIPDKVTDKTFPYYTPNSMEKMIGLAGKNVKNKDLSQLSLDFMANTTFDSDTVWPKKKKLPKDFSPEKWLEAAKNPGLQINTLHKEGYTGKGISVAIIDKPILAEHEEIKQNIVYTKVGEEDKNLHFHGMSIASILSGKTCGVAPDSKLYYFAVPSNVDTEFDHYNYYILAMNKLFEVNDSLPQKDKIKVVSISDYIPEDNQEIWSKWNEILEEAAKQDVTVIYSNNAGMNFIYGGCPPFKDKNDPSNYTVSSSYAGRGNFSKLILLPSDYRTTASNYGNNEYVYWSEGGFSWAIPYLAGVYALGLQVDPDLTYDKFVDLIKETKDVNADNMSVINPVKLINKVKEGKK